MATANEWTVADMPDQSGRTVIVIHRFVGVKRDPVFVDEHLIEPLTSASHDSRHNVST
ncbi:hypothetical protein C455_12298 [Haloferax larsenii JCM 13917]|nr:hypothetical protein [Haloferax larsenii]ELZ78465.1 hypothetical protein C455_12298 [Haloferax larsenii JCM 13917]